MPSDFPGFDLAIIGITASNNKDAETGNEYNGIKVGSEGRLGMMDLHPYFLRCTHTDAPQKCERTLTKQYVETEPGRSVYL